LLTVESNQTISALIRRLWNYLPQRRRNQFLVLLVFTVIASFAEIFSIGAVLPFLSVLVAPDHVFAHPAAAPFIQKFGWTSAHQLLLPLTLLFGVAAVVSGAARLSLLWANTRLCSAAGADLSIDIYRRTLYQPYEVHVARNSSEVINAISTKINSFIYIITMLMTLISSVVMLFAILFALLAVDPVIALSAFGGFGLIYGGIAKLTRARLIENSRLVASESTQVVKSLQEGLGGIRDVLLDGSQAEYCTVYSNAVLPLRRAEASSAFIGTSPRFVVEALGMLLIAILAFSMAQPQNGIGMAIPVLGALALGAQRLLPVLQQAYGSWSAIRSGQISLKDVLDLLAQPMPNHIHLASHYEPMPFERSLKLRAVSFRYGPDLPWVVKGIDLSIRKSSRIGFIGPTGGGKSTLLDIVMGLLQPTEGWLEVDGMPVTIANQRAWQRHVAHVPQSIFLADSSIAENIAFGVPKDSIDHKRVLHAAEQAQIAQLIDTLPQKYMTPVGERGVRLSGGQRQRIGIARALYKQADVIIFDEATSALDGETEEAIMQSIEALSGDLTVLLIAHRLSTLRNCSEIIEITKGDVRMVGSYQDLMNERNV